MVKFSYPEQGWSTGRMRKRGQRISGDIGEGAAPLADSPVLDTIERMKRERDKAQGIRTSMDFQRRGQPETSTAEMERAAGFGVAARGGVPGAAVDIGGIAAGKQVRGAIDEQKADIQEALDGVAKGDMSQAWFNKMLKKFGWSQSSEPGKFRDPEGNDHLLTKEAEAR